MTDNEKRAHDLSTVLLPQTIDYKAKETVENGTASNGVDAFSVYMETYNNLLDLFNREFPEGK